MAQIASLSTQEFRNRIFRKFKDKRVPVMGTFELTGRCNFNCKMCYVHTQPNSFFAKGERNGDWWIELINEACKSGMLFALLTGGECLLHPDFKRIYKHLRAQGVYVSVNTNGYLLTDEMIAFFKQDPPFEIQITLYGTDEESYENVTGVRAFARVQGVFNKLKDAGLNYKVAVTPNTYAPNETERIIRYLKQREIKHFVNAVLFVRHEDGKPTDLSDQNVDVEEMIRYFRTMSEQEPVPIPLEQLPAAGGGRTEPRVGRTCNGGRVSFFMTWDGQMQACNAFHHERVRIDDVSQFMNAWEQITNASKKYLMPVECEQCPYRTVCLGCPAHRSSKENPGHCDPAVCNMTKQLVAAGVKKLDELSVDPQGL